jgi:hypothetical protein
MTLEVPLCATDVARGVARLLWQRNYTSLCEVPLPNHRRADMLALGPKGEIVIIEIKVSHQDLITDPKWRDYLEYCDQFYWAVPPGRLAETASTEAFLPERAGLILADRYEAAITRPAATHPLSPARRKAETLRIARLTASRAMRTLDPGIGGELAL